MSDVVLVLAIMMLAYWLGRLQGARTDLAPSGARSQTEPEQGNGSKGSIDPLIRTTPEPATADAASAMDRPIGLSASTTDEISGAKAAAWARILGENPRAREDLAALEHRRPRQFRSLARAEHNMQKWSAGVDSNALARIAHWERLMLSLGRKSR